MSPNPLILDQHPELGERVRDDLWSTALHRIATARSHVTSNTLSEINTKRVRQISVLPLRTGLTHLKRIIPTEKVASAMLVFALKEIKISTVLQSGRNASLRGGFFRKVTRNIGDSGAVRIRQVTKELWGRKF